MIVLLDVLVFWVSLVICVVLCFINEIDEIILFEDLREIFIFKYFGLIEVSNFSFLFGMFLSFWGVINMLFLFLNKEIFFLEMLVLYLDVWDWENIEDIVEYDLDIFLELVVDSRDLFVFFKRRFDVLNEGIDFLVYSVKFVVFGKEELNSLILLLLVVGILKFIVLIFLYCDLSYFVLFLIIVFL